MALFRKGKKEKGIPGFLSKFGLHLALISILALAGLSLLTLGLLKKGAEEDKPLPVVENKVSGTIAEIPKPPEPKSPPPPSPSPVKPKTAFPADTTPTTAADLAAQPLAGPDQEKIQTTQTAKTEEAGTSLTVTQAQPADQQPPLFKPPSSQEEPAAAPAQPSPTETAAAPPTPPAERKSAFFTPPPQDQQVDAVDGLVKPVWQTVDQNWDKIRLGDSAPDDLTADGAAWRQIEVGQTDQAGSPPPPESAEPKVKPQPLAKLKPPPSSAAGLKKPPPVKSAPTAKRPKPKPGVTKAQKTKRRAKAASTRKIKLAIINESGRPGQGEVYAQVLAAMGYKVACLQDRPARPGPTQILYGSGQRASARALAKRIPGQKRVTALNEKAPHDIIILIR